jgi:hypothetical protein
VNAHVIRHLDSPGRTAGRTGHISVSEWDSERRVRPTITASTPRVGATAETFARCAAPEERMPMPRRRALLDALRAVLSPGRPAGGVIGS